MKPTIPITDQRFNYVPSHLTDVKATFERIRRQQEQNSKEQAAKVAVIKQRKA